MNRKKDGLRNTIHIMLRYLRPYAFAILLIVLFNIASAAFEVTIPKITGKATTAIFNGATARYAGTGGMDYEKILRFIWQLLAFYLAGNAFYFAQGFTMNFVSQKIAFQMRKEMTEKINRLPLSYFDAKTHGEILSRVTNDVETVCLFIRSSLSQITTSLTTVVFGLFMMLTISPVMTLVVVLFAPLSLASSTLIVKLSQKYFKTQQETLGQVTGLAEEAYGGHSVMKAFNAQERFCEEFNKANDSLYESAWKSQAFSGLLSPLIRFIGNLGYIAVSILGSFLAIRKVIEVGDILACIQYVRSFTNPLAQIASTTGSIQSMFAAAERVFAFLLEPEEESEPQNPASAEGLSGVVAFEHVRFGYSPDKIIIRDFTATIRPGQRIAIVGPTGAGKTTIVKLLMRFYDLNGGKITIDGIEINRFKREDLRGMIGMVLQDTWLYNGTIMDNIRYGRLSAEDSEVIGAGQSAYVDHFIRTLPHAYDMVLEEDASNISQGQKQLLTIARAILADPKILILDEATSSVDTRTEQRIQQAMNNLMEGRTCFIIAHRLSTIRDADLILVMNDGDIVEQGSHEELLERKGFYADLYESQFETGLVS